MRAPRGHCTESGIAPRAFVVLQVKEMRLTVLCAMLSLLLLGSVAVDKNNFKTCSQSSFCKLGALIRNYRLQRSALWTLVLVFFLLLKCVVSYVVCYSNAYLFHQSQP